jgi:hypothetical protein
LRQAARLHKGKQGSVFEEASTFSTLVPLNHTQQRAEVLHTMAVFHSMQRRRGLPVLFHKHRRFLDFRPFGAPQPTFINVLRHPVDRAVSQFYYERWGDRFNAYKEAEIKLRGAQKDFDINACVAVPRAQRTCGFNHADENLQTGLFCGFADVCACVGPMATRRCGAAEKLQALALAKRNLARQYTAIGLTERLPETLQMFERLLPAVFGNITRLPVLHDRVTAVEPFHVDPLPHTVQRLADEELALDVQLYSFATRLFHARWQVCRSRWET